MQLLTLKNWKRRKPCLKKQAECECLLAKEAEEKRFLKAKKKQKAIELKIQQKLNKETEEREAKMT